MKIRTLKRKVIIREYDFDRVRAEAFAVVGVNSIYDRAEFHPLRMDDLEKQKVVDILKGKETPLSYIDMNMEHPSLTVRQLKDYLYDDRYYNWNVTFDDEGYVCVQARKNTPKSRLGWGVFEKDIECRI